MATGLLGQAPGQKRELIDRKRPRHTGRDDEREGLRLVCFRAGDEVFDFEWIANGAEAEGHRVPVRCPRATADAHDQEVVAALAGVAEVIALALRNHDRMRIRANRASDPADEARAQLRDRELEVAVLRGLVGEWLFDDEGLVNEVSIGGDQRGFSAIAGEIAQGEQRLDAGDAATQDQHVRL